ncbi:Poly-beta-1,6-N-acetyl-D-glucosamine synthase [Dorea longicatena]|uniref:Poly-beta-1,6-N-acetyl-D-glucosamine synthase n=1 Tax=Dorea longicatena TaxID=88431 RepID=A0A564TXZ8_9FIRM|nr:glycosyltransferase [Dorea longicatena]VUX12125.1 Poly-beta-1,6-N-acetyl-D-glucosamine synthase [Dorea longicatena]
MKSISVLIPMHNEEQVLSNVLDSLLQCEYDRDRLEIIPINDNSTDRTREMLDEYHRNELQYRRSQKKRLKMKLRNYEMMEK